MEFLKRRKMDSSIRQVIDNINSETAYAYDYETGTIIEKGDFLQLNRILVALVGSRLIADETLSLLFNIYEDVSYESLIYSLLEQDEIPNNIYTIIHLADMFPNLNYEQIHEFYDSSLEKRKAYFAEAFIEVLGKNSKPSEKPAFLKKNSFTLQDKEVLAATELSKLLPKIEQKLIEIIRNMIIVSEEQLTEVLKDEDLRKYAMTLLPLDQEFFAPVVSYFGPFNYNIVSETITLENFMFYPRNTSDFSNEDYNGESEDVCCQCFNKVYIPLYAPRLTNGWEDFRVFCSFKCMREKLYREMMLEDGVTQECCEPNGSFCMPLQRECEVVVTNDVINYPLMVDLLDRMEKVTNEIGVFDI